MHRLVHQQQWVWGLRVRSVGFWHVVIAMHLSSRLSLCIVAYLHRRFKGESSTSAVQDYVENNVPNQLSNALLSREQG